jgi:hypothetical protein
VHSLIFWYGISSGISQIPCNRRYCICASTHAWTHKH